MAMAFKMLLFLSFYYEERERAQRNKRESTKKQKEREREKMPPKKEQKKTIKNFKPFVSICTPTYNRRPFIATMIQCFMHQTYPKDRMEWIIVDDGTDKIGDLVKDIPQVKYYSYDTKMPLGKKRNLMHDKTKGTIIVYLDDDDYYPPERVSHAVEMLRSHPEALCAGSGEIYVYYNHINKMYQFGPYGPKHATAGTFAFKRELMLQQRYDDTAELAEEAHFLKNYTIPFVQLDPLKTILVFSHAHNTFDKKQLLKQPPNMFMKESAKTVDMFIKEPALKDFFTRQMDLLLVEYKPGDISMKPGVIKQMDEMAQQRMAAALQQQQQQQQQMVRLDQAQLQNIAPESPLGQQIMTLQQQQKRIAELELQVKQMASGQGSTVPLNIVQTLQTQAAHIMKLQNQIQVLEQENQALKAKL